VKEFVLSHPGTFIIEQNRDAQLKTMLVTEEQINIDRLISVLHYDGTPITARFIADHISKHIAAHTVVPINTGRISA
jgi:2-oxoglutarate ferredoxin oxidoreductase subunit alpha